MKARAIATVVVLSVSLFVVVVISRSGKRSKTSADLSLGSLQSNRWNNSERHKAATDLAKLGDAAIPALDAALRDKDSKLSQKYEVWRARLPPARRGLIDTTTDCESETET